MVEIFRIEHHDGMGPWGKGLARKLDERGHRVYDKPGPRDDWGLKNVWSRLADEQGEYIFGFVSPEQLLGWFTKDTLKAAARFRKTPVVISVYDVDEHYYSSDQAIFKADRFETTPIHVYTVGQFLKKYA